MKVCYSVFGCLLRLFDCSSLVCSIVRYLILPASIKKLQVWQLTSLSFLIICGFAHGQTNSARLVILNGGSVDFTFNSIDKWQNGIVYDNFTTLGIGYEDLADAPDATAIWELVFKANDGDLDITFMPGDDGNFIELNKVEIRAENALGLAGSCLPAAFKVLTNIDQVLAQGDGLDCGATGSACVITARQLFLDYQFGVLNTVLGEAPDHYVEDIIITLQPNTPLACP